MGRALAEQEIIDYMNKFIDLDNLSLWDFPEELRYWKSDEILTLQRFRNISKTHDPKRRPGMMYIPGHYKLQDIENLVEYMDIVPASCYVHYMTTHKHSYVRFQIEQTINAIKNKGFTLGKDYINNEKTVVSILELYNGSPGMTPEGSYHDFWSSIASGAKGILIYAYGYRNTYPECWDILCTSASQLAGPEGIDKMILNGTERPEISYSITSGPTETEPFIFINTTMEVVYPSINILAKEYNGYIYIIAVNSCESAQVQAKISGIDNNVINATVLFENRNVSINNGIMNTETFAPLGVHIYKIEIPTGPTHTPLHYYKLDETSGSLAYDTPLSSPANGSHSITTLGTPGQINTCYTVNNDTIDCGIPSDLINNEKITFSAWVSFSSLNQYNVVVSRRGLWYQSLFIKEPGDLRGFIRSADGTHAYSVSTEKLSINTWYHIAMTYNDTTDRVIRLYINGTEVLYSTQNALTGTLDQTSTKKLLLAGDSANYVIGEIDEVAVFNEAISSADIIHYMNNGIPGDTIPPSIPQNLTGNPINGSQIDLTWDPATDNVGVTGYKLYRNSVEIANLAGTTFSDTGLQDGATYLYKVKAYDQAGNESGFSTEIIIFSKLPEVEMNFSASWSMMSLPLRLHNPTPSQLFPEAAVIYAYEKGAGYVRIENNEKMHVGSGYWILFNEDQNYVLRGEPINSYSITVNESGWEMIGGCTSGARPTADSCTMGVIYRYRKGAGYKLIPASEDLKPGEGFWILLKDVFNRCQLTVESTALLSRFRACYVNN